MPQPQGARLPAPRLHSPHAAKTMQSLVMFSDRLLRPRIEHLLAVLSQCSVGGDMPVEGLQIEMRDFVEATRHVGAQRVFVGDRLVVDEAVGAGRADGPAHGVERAAFYPGNLCPTSAAELRMPFTTGILIGIGETRAERLEALFAIRDLHRRFGHIQEGSGVSTLGTRNSPPNFSLTGGSGREADASGNPCRGVRQSGSAQRCAVGARTWRSRCGFRFPNRPSPAWPRSSVESDRLPYRLYFLGG